MDTWMVRGYVEGFGDQKETFSDMDKAYEYEEWLESVGATDIYIFLNGNMVEHILEVYA